VGDLFADHEATTLEDKQIVSDLIAGKIDIPLPTYFTLGSHGLPQPVIDRLEDNTGEVCTNLYFLGKRTTIKTSEGIKIVALGGVLDPNITVGASKDKYPPYYSGGDAHVLKGANTADILITNQWPTDIRTASKVSFVPGDQESTPQRCIAELCSTLKPRYHFSTSPTAFFEREPFFHVPNESAPDAYPITRFLSLAAYNNPTKQKWIYAFSLDPTAAPPVAIPPGTTASPLSFTDKKRPALPDQSSYRFSTDSHAHSHHGNDHSYRRKGAKRQKAAPPTPSECFFCLSNPNLASHLITSIGDNAYLTTAKGPLTTDSSYPSLGFPGHMLIIPLTHAPTLASIEDAETRQSTYAEMQQYRRALHGMLASRSRGKLGAVTWEVSRQGGVHAHWQILPVMAEQVRRGLVEAAFKVEAENEKYPVFVKKDLGDGAGEMGDFFRVMVWAPEEVAGEDSPGGEGKGKGKETSWMLPLDSSFRFDLQFGRRVMAKLLGLEKRLLWQDCAQEQLEEVRDAEAFKEAFKDFDFALDE